MNLIQNAEVFGCTKIIECKSDNITGFLDSYRAFWKVSMHYYIHDYTPENAENSPQKWRFLEDEFSSKFQISSFHVVLIFRFSGFSGEFS